MNLSAVFGYKASLRMCGIEILLNVAFIEKEIETLPVSAELRAEMMAVCNHTKWAGYEVMSEYHEYDDRIDEGLDAPRLQLIANRILSNIDKDLIRLHELATKLEALSATDLVCGSAYALVAESAANIMIPLSRARDAVTQISD